MENGLSDFDDERINDDDKTMIENNIQRMLDGNKSRDYFLPSLATLVINNILTGSSLDDAETLAGKILDHVFPSWKEGSNESDLIDGSIKNERPPVDYGISTTKLSHTFDVERFVEHVKDVRSSYYGGNEDTKIHDAPYFAFIQSSGMGKTKIMYEACKKLRSGGWACEFVLPRNFTSLEKKNGEVFSKRIDLERYKKLKPCTASDAATTVFDALDRAFENKQQAGKLFLCFDESQAYLRTEKFLPKNEDNEETERTRKEEKKEFIPSI